jgi:large subunit ribosomal protein L5
MAGSTKTSARTPRIAPPEQATGTNTPIRPRLKVRYDAELRPQLKDTLGLANIMMVPRLEKIVVNMGVGRATQQQSLLDGAVRDLTIITGQKPLVTKAKKSIAGFKLREGNSIGAKVTLRGDRMWEFFDRLISLAIPRIRDFRGLNPTSFDGRGNYTFGVTEQLIFPEIDYDKVDQPRGMDITIVTTARTNAEGRALLDAFGFPFRREGQGQ